MNEAAYNAIAVDAQGVTYSRLKKSIVRLTGRDRAIFLQGQVSNDVSKAEQGTVLMACLLNNTGHLVALLDVIILGDTILLETDHQRADVVRKTLERFVVRERVEIDLDNSSVLTVQGGGAATALAKVTEMAIPSDSPAGFVHRVDCPIGSILVDRRSRFTASLGYDLIVNAQSADNIMASLESLPESIELDDHSRKVLQVESGEPQWGTELDESIIPLEAGLENAISYSKGCYMGQEIIARIHSRGHTNRSLVGFRFESAVETGSTVTAVNGDRSGQEVGRITSFVASPRFGLIGLGYVRNGYIEAGTPLAVDGINCTIAGLPFNNE